MYSTRKGAYHDVSCTSQVSLGKKIPAVYVLEVCIVGNISETFVVFIC